MKLIEEKLRIYYLKVLIATVIYVVVIPSLYYVSADIASKLGRVYIPALTIDYMIPFVSIFAIPYVFGFYFFISATYAYVALVKRELFWKYYASLLLTYGTAFMIFLIFPTRITLRPSTVSSDILSQIMIMYYQLDPVYNCLPSLHVAISTLSAYWLSRIKPRYKWLWWSTTGIIFLSTLFVRQHYVLDGIAGFILGYACSDFINRKLKQQDYMKYVR